jgi:hypothetical protein
MNDLTTIVERVAPLCNNSNTNYNLPQCDDGIIRPYTLTPGEFFPGVKYITYPEVKPYMYLINTRGMIFNANTGAQLHYNDRDRYCKITLRTINETSKTFSVHRLIAYAFCNPPVNFRNMVVNHINTDKYYNYANNLEWITASANNQHAMEYHGQSNTYIENNRPVINEDFVKELCKQFKKGKTDTEIMRELGMKINSANHSLLNDIRKGNTWAHVTKRYKFRRSSVRQAHNSEEKEQIRNYMLEGKDDKEIFYLINGRELREEDKSELRWKNIHNIRFSTWGYQNLPHKKYITRW